MALRHRLKVPEKSTSIQPVGDVKKPTIEVTKSVEWDECFVLTAHELKKLDSSFRRFAENVSYDVSCADELDYHFESLEHLLRYENTPDGAIESVTVTAFSGDFGRSASLRMSNVDTPNVWLSVTGERSLVVQLDDGVPWPRPAFLRRVTYQHL